MPANLPPEYFKAEQRYLQAKTLEEKIRATEELIRIAPKHKGTEKLLRMLKRRLAKLRGELEERERRRGGRGPSFAVKKEGCAQVALVGLPNSGKSTLLRKLTAARPEVADYPFTTRLPVPGMMEYEDVQVQLVEIPALVEGSSLGRGLGAQPLSAARNADAIALVVDASSDPQRQLEILVRELEEGGIRLNRSPPRVTIQRREEGGIVLRGEELVEGGREGILELLREHRIHNALVVVEERMDLRTLEELLEGSVVYRPCFVLLTKTDLSPGTAGGAGTLQGDRRGEAAGGAEEGDLPEPGPHQGLHQEAQRGALQGAPGPSPRIHPPGRGQGHPQGAGEGTEGREGLGFHPLPGAVGAQGLPPAGWGRGGASHLRLRGASSPSPPGPPRGEPPPSRPPASPP
jgi:small GTP-binding protein